MRCELDVDDLAGLEAVAPAAVGLPGAPRLTELSEERLDILGGPDLFDRHRQELVTRVAVTLNCGVVDLEELQRRHLATAARIARIVGRSSECLI
jgi:hypothetical protein